MSEIVLDRKTFEALAIDTRVRILKALRERRKTQSELSKELALAPSTISEHLDKMLEAKLIAKKKDHHKWIYYELTETGSHILAPQKASIFVFALSASLIVIVGAFMAFYPAESAGEPMLAMEQAPAAMDGSRAVAGTDSTLLAVVLASAVIVIMLYFYWVRKQRAIKN